MGISRDGVQGLSPIALAKENLGISAAAELSAASMYANGLRSEIAITVPAGLSDEAFERLRQDIREKHQGASNTSNPLLLEGEGAKAQVLNMSAQDAQFLESRKFSELQVAMMFGVPPHKLGILDRATFSNINEQSLSFVTDTIQPANARLETSAWRDLLTDREKKAGYVIKYDTDGLIKSDLASRMEGYQKSVGGPIQTVNEARQKEGLPPVDGGDVLLQPLNMGGSAEQPENNATVLNYLAKREVRDTKKDKNPTEWAEKFYTKHAELLVEDFGVTQDSAVAYAAKRIKQVLAGETLNIDQVKTDLGQIL
jgi:phage portal protein BeeE